MIPSPSAEFTTEETRTIGSWPFFKYTIFPNYFRTGVGAGLGTFTDCSFVAPDRIQVDDDAVSASWASDTQTANVTDFPTPGIFTLTANLPGYDLTLQYRTNSVDPSGDSWVTFANGDTLNLQQYYQWQASWGGFRGWAYDTLVEAEASSISAWALDAPDPEDEYESYASDAVSGDNDSYLEAVTIAGELRIPDQDILDGGQLSLSAENDFSALISSDHTMRLLNRNNQYSPRHANFIFAGENDWQRKNLKIEFGFKTLPDGFWGRPWGIAWGEGTRVETDTITLYEGQILRWGPIPVSMDENSYDAGDVEIYSRDTIALCMERLIGIPDDDGTPNPLVTGRLLREATALGDNSPDDPVKEIDFEDANILNEVDSVDESGASNDLTVSTTEPYNGSQCLRSYVTSAGYARGWLNLPITSDNVLFRAAVRFAYVPTVPMALNADFLRVRVAGSDKVVFKINNDFKIHVYVMGVDTKETDWSLAQGQGIWQDVVLGIYGRNPGCLRLSVNGDQVLNWEGTADSPLNLTALNTIQMVGLGVNATLAETWEVYYDDARIYNPYYPEAYYIPGGPFTEIGAVYQDGALTVKKGEAKYTPGRAVLETDITKYPLKGMVTFDTLTNKPAGTIYMMVRKDTNDHPADALTEILTSGDRDSAIDATSFAAAKTASPDDSIGCYFDNVTMADAILGITQRCLLGFVVSQGDIKLLTYDGTAPTSYDWVIDNTVCAGLSVSDDSEAKKNKVSAKWGWYDVNSRLFYTAQDAASITKLGVLEEQLDFSWGDDVGSDNSEMVRDRADCLLNRLKGSTLLLEDVEVLPWKFVRAEIGDVANVDISYFGPAENYRIVGKDLDMNPPYKVTLTLAMFPGES